MRLCLYEIRIKVLPFDTWKLLGKIWIAHPSGCHPPHVFKCVALICQSWFNVTEDDIFLALLSLEKNQQWNDSEKHLDYLFDSLLRLTTMNTPKLCIIGPLWGKSITSNRPVMQKDFPCHDAIIMLLFVCVFYTCGDERLFHPHSTCSSVTKKLSNKCDIYVTEYISESNILHILYPALYS